MTQPNPIKQANVPGLTVGDFSSAAVGPTSPVFQVFSGSKGSIANPLSENGGVGNYGPIVMRDMAPGGSHPGGVLGIYAQGGGDPNIGMAYFGNLAAGDWQAAFQIEADFDTTGSGGTHLIEGYFYINSAAVTNMWPMMMRYDRDAGFMTDVGFTVGQGHDSFGNPGGQGFSVFWDAGAGGFPAGQRMFQLTPNRIKLDPVSGTGATNVGQTRLNLYSSAGNGSAVSLTYNGADAEGTLNPSILLEATAATGGDLFSGGARVCFFTKPTATAAGIQIPGGIRLGDTTNTFGTLWSTSGAAPSSSLGNNGDICFRTDTPTTSLQRVYIKSAGAWVGIL